MVSEVVLGGKVAAKVIAVSVPGLPPLAVSAGWALFGLFALSCIGLTLLFKRMEGPLYRFVVK